ncbi:MAG: diguanylate cyclase domain-containing protein [Bacilli bacterium]
MKNNKIKKKKKQKKGKVSYLKICIITIIIVLLGVGAYFFLTAEDDETSLTVLEKQWIMRNKKTLIDINVPNNLSILADNGEGVIFDYLTKIEKDTELGFNKKSYNYKADNDTLNGLSILVLSNEDKPLKDDVLFTEDNYVLISKKEGYINDFDSLYQKSIAVLKEDEGIITDYTSSNFKYEKFDSVEEVIDSINKSKVEYAIVPRYYVLEEIVQNNIYVNYSFNNLSNKIVLRLNDNERLSSIMKKYLESFKKNNYMNSYEEEFMNFYLNNTTATDVETTSLSSRVYTYGYVKDSSYNILSNDKLYGYAGEYINLLSNMANIDLEYKEYSSSEKLDEAIKKGEVDIAFIDFDYKNEQGLYTINAFNPQMVAISKTNYRITNKQGLENRKLYTVKNTYLESYLKDNYNSVITAIKNVNTSIPDDGILILDEIDYHYYTNEMNFNDYYLLLKDDYQGEYKYFVKNEESVMYDFVNFMLMYTDSSDIKITAIDNLIASSTSKGGFAHLYLMIVLIIIIPIIALFTLLALSRTRKNSKLLHKEDVLKYSDMLTSLKNRNYLRAHIDEWDEMKITPRTIIIADLNNLKYINDNYGQEEGNILIKKAAAILINTQLEKSEIIRTDGNEFLIYLIGYNKTQINTYINKLSREFEKLPHGFGAAIGYSMIEDEIKTIDDAINEASIEMRMDKEQNYK